MLIATTEVNFERIESLAKKSLVCLGRDMLEATSTGCT